MPAAPDRLEVDEEIGIQVESASESEADASMPAPAPARSRKGVGGPRTAEGKARSARNALKHGLRAAKHIPAELARDAEEHARNLAQELQPATPHQEWLVRRMGLAAARLDRIEAIEAATLRDRIERAEMCWDDDQALAAEETGARLAKDPSRVVARLKLTKQGVAWLIRRWEGLDAVLDQLGTWDDAQRRLALDLLGTPAELRAGASVVRDDSTREDLAKIVKSQLRTLQAALEDRLKARDAFERRLGREGVFLRDDTSTRSLRRYENDQVRAMVQALREYRRLAPSTQPRRDPTLRGTPLHELAFGPMPPPPSSSKAGSVVKTPAAASGGLDLGSLREIPDYPSLRVPEGLLPSTAPWYDLERVSAEWEASKASRAGGSKPSALGVGLALGAGLGSGSGSGAGSGSGSPSTGPNRQARRRRARR